MNTLVHTILNALLDQAEQPARERVVRVRLNPKQHTAYFSEHDVSPRRETNQTLKELAAQGIVRLQWHKWDENNLLDAVDLLPERVADVYTITRRTPRSTQHSELINLLDQHIPRANWHVAFLAWARTQLTASRAIAPLKLDDARWNADLLRGLSALAELTAPTLERIFSVRVFGNSKRFTELKSAIIRVLRQHDQTAEAYGEDDAALLRAYLLDRVPEYVPLAGSLRFNQGQTLLDVGLFRPSVALSATTLRMASIAECAATRVVTVENSTSFSELALHRATSDLIVYTGGFASPTVISLLRQIRTAQPQILLLHWGDLDAGGLRILAHVRREVGAIEPLAMDVATFEQHRAHAQPLTVNDRRALEQLRTVPELTDCGALIEHLLAAGLKLEQEAVALT